MKIKFLAVAFAALLPLAASADVSYRYFDASYQMGGELDFGFGTADTDGFALTGAMSINDNWYVQFDYLTLATDPDIGDADGYTLALGWHGDLFFAALGWQAADTAGVDDSGYNIDFGARTMLSENFELNGHVGMSDLGDVGTSTNYGFGAVWFFGDNMGVSFNYDLGTISDFAATAGFDVDTSTYGFGFRYNFD